MTPSELVMKRYKDLGYSVHNTEYWTGRGGKKRDFLGFGDLMALKPPEAPVAIQATTKQHGPERMRKILSLSTARLWLGCGGRIHLVTVEEIRSEGRVEYAYHTQDIRREMFQ
jgi:hypothetical protein